jgi:hypothetical protein
MRSSIWIHLTWVAAVAIIVLGCGGGGGGGSTTSTTSTSSTGTTGADSIVTRLLAETSPGSFEDPLGIQVGDGVNFVLVNYDVTKGTTTVLPTGAFSTTDLTSAAGTLSANGRYVAKKATGASYTVSTNFAGTNYSAPYTVNPVEPRVSGFVRDDNGKAVGFATVQFYDVSSNLVGQATADLNGAFIASVATTAVRFNLKSSSVSSASYFAEFSYGTGTYDILSVGCSAPTPTLPASGTVPLPNAVTLFAAYSSNGFPNTPPAPPSCSP